MSDYERVKAFVDGAKTGIDWMYHQGRLADLKPSEYADGFRHALDAIGGYFDEIEEHGATET